MTDAALTRPDLGPRVGELQPAAPAGPPMRLDDYLQLLSEAPLDHVTSLLHERALAAHTGNLSFYDDSRGSYRGYVNISGQEPVYHSLNLSPLVILPAMLAAFLHGIDVDLEKYVERPLQWLHDNRYGEIAPHVFGVLEEAPGKEFQIWLKYSAEKAAIEADYAQILRQFGNKTSAEQHAERAIGNAEFIIAAAHNDYSPKFDLVTGQWIPSGWHAKGRSVEALARLWKITGDRRFRDYALLFGERLIGLWDARRGPFFRDEEGHLCFDSDLAGPPLRALLICYRLSVAQGQPEKARRFLRYAVRFARWLEARQERNGAYPLRIFKERHLNLDRDSREELRWVLSHRREPGSALHLNGVTSPGDVANITLGLIELMECTGRRTYLESIMLGTAYCLYVQNMDPASVAYGLPPSWRHIEDMEDPWQSLDDTYSGDQGGLLERLFLLLEESMSDRPELYR